MIAPDKLFSLAAFVFFFLKERFSTIKALKSFKPWSTTDKLPLRFKFFISSSDKYSILRPRIKSELRASGRILATLPSEKNKNPSLTLPDSSQTINLKIRLSATLFAGVYEYIFEFTGSLKNILLDFSCANFPKYARLISTTPRQEFLLNSEETSLKLSTTFSMLFLIPSLFLTAIILSKSLCIATIDSVPVNFLFTSLKFWE